MASKKQRVKAAAQTWTAHSEDDVASGIKQIGDAGREITRLTAAMNDEIAVITEKYQAEIAPLKERMKALQNGVQTWCEACRDKLTKGGRTKTANFITGNVLWRTRPPSVSIRGVDAVLEALKSLGLGRFIRTKEEPNKEAILNEPSAVTGVKGVTINSGVEDFVIEPFEQEAE